MKKQFIRFGILLFLAIGGAAAGSGILYAQAAVSLDEAVQAGAQEIEARLSRGVKVVVLNFNSPSQRFSNYVLDEMMTALVRSGKITVVDRANLALIQQEMNFQMSGDVSDASAQSIGQILGAQSIVSGNIEDMGVNYRIRFRTIAVESAAIQVLSSFNVRKDAQVSALMSGAGAGNTAASSYSGIGEYPNGLNYPTSRKIGAGVLNMAFGLGSFTMGDWVGGLIVGGVEAAGFTLFILSITALQIEEVWYDSFGANANYYWNMPLFFAGIAVYSAGAIYGYIRPFTYDRDLAKKNGTYYTFEGNPMQNITFAPVPAKGGMGMGVFYRASY